MALLVRAAASLSKPAWIAADAMIVLVGLRVGYGVSPWDTADPAVQIVMWKAWLISALAIVLAGLMFGLYEEATLLAGRRLVLKPVATVCLATCLAYVVIAGALYAPMSRRIALWMVGFYMAGGIGLRAAAYAVLSRYRRQVLIVGTGPSARFAAEKIEGSLKGRYQVAGLVRTGPEDGRGTVDGRAIVGRVEDLARVCAQQDVREIVIASEELGKPDVVESSLACLGLGCRVTNQSTFHEKAFGEVPVEHIGPDWFLFADLGVWREEFATVKRVVDAVLSLVGLVVTLPLWPAIAAAIRLDSRGPVLHRQLRVGQGGQSFVLYKFRTMQEGAEPNGSVWAAKNDPRITWVGRWLRRTHLDELPQLWNVLRGDMSLVGPRPERPDIAEGLALQIPYYNERHLIKPGLTGWAQINFRYGASVEDARKKLQLDLYYLKHMSWELDAAILLRTAGMVLSGSA